MIIVFLDSADPHPPVFASLRRASPFVMAGFHRLHPATHRASICENVLGRLIALEPKQADLLTRICDGPLIHAEDVHGLLANAAPVDKPVKPAKQAK